MGNLGPGVSLEQVVNGQHLRRADWTRRTLQCSAFNEVL
jgi:hypothetical protein